MDEQDKGNGLAIVVLSLIWAFGVLCGVAFTLLIQAGIIVK